MLTDQQFPWMAGVKGPDMYTLPQHPAMILVVDEDPVLRAQVAATLGMAGYECYPSESATDAFEAARRLHLDLLVCDVAIRDTSGLELYQQIRQIPHNADVPALFLAHDQAADVIRRVHEAGGTFCLRKPCDPEVLVELVGKALWMPHLVRTALERTEAASRPRPAGLNRYLSQHTRLHRTSSTDTIW